MSDAKEIPPDVRELKEHLDSCGHQLKYFSAAAVFITGPSTGAALEHLGNAVQDLHAALWVIARANGVEQPEQKGK